VELLKNCGDATVCVRLQLTHDPHQEATGSTKLVAGSAEKENKTD
jgi:hypothetical protein